MLLVIVDDPRSEKPGMGITAFSNAAPVAGSIIRRSAALLGIKPQVEDEASVAVNDVQLV